MSLISRHVSHNNLTANLSSRFAVCLIEITHQDWCDHRHQCMQPSLMLKMKMLQPSSWTYFSFAIFTSYGNQITLPAKHEDNLEMKVKNPDESQEDGMVYLSDTKRKLNAELSSLQPWWRGLQLQLKIGLVFALSEHGTTWLCPVGWLGSGVSAAFLRPVRWHWHIAVVVCFYHFIYMKPVEMCNLGCTNSLFSGNFILVVGQLTQTQVGKWYYLLGLLHRQEFRIHAGWNWVW